MGKIPRAFLKEWATEAKVDSRKRLEEKRPAWTLPSCVTLGKLLVFSELQFLHL